MKTCSSESCFRTNDNCDTHRFKPYVRRSGSKIRTSECDTTVLAAENSIRPTFFKEKKTISEEKIAHLLCIHRLRLPCWAFTVAKHLSIFSQ